MDARDTWLRIRQPVLAEPIVMGGGLDIMTPPFRLKPGYCRQAQNFECSLYGGYSRIAGYERFDGQPKPSAAAYTVLNATSITGGAVGNTLTGAGGATGKIIAVTSTYFVLTQRNGTAYVNGENLNVGAGTIAVASGTGTVSGAPSRLLHAQYMNLAADVYRALIAAVPGSGNILGINLYNDVVYAFRTDAGATETCMYKSTTGGWVKVALGRKLLFTTGNLSIAEGTVITGATSGATATLKRQMLETGTYGGGNATGKFIFATVTGTFQNGENLQTGGVTRAVANGADTAITLVKNGRFEFVNANFTGSTSTYRMYGVDGVNPAFEFDGTTFCPISTGMTTDTPTHIAAHLYRLFLSFNASVQYSTAGAPYQWSAVTGAAELAMGENITGFSVQPASSTTASLAVFTTGRLSVLYGTGASNFVLLPYADEIGAAAYTMQNLINTIFLDAQGITNISTTIEFGNFSPGVLTNQIKSMMTAWKGLATASGISRDRSQYRLFFSNGYGLYCTVIGKKVIGVMPVLFPVVVRCAAQGILSDSTEASFFGSSTGMVYQLDKGTSFDGDDIDAFFSLAYNFSGRQRLLKQYRGSALEVSGTGYAEFNVGYSLGYGSSDYLQPGTQQLTGNFSAAQWDAGYTWDAGQWDGTSIAPSTFEMDGEAENVSLAIGCIGDYFSPFTVSGGVLHLSPRREMR